MVPWGCVGHLHVPNGGRPVSGVSDRTRGPAQLPAGLRRTPSLYIWKWRPTCSVDADFSKASAVLAVGPGHGPGSGRGPVARQTRQPGAWLFPPARGGCGDHRRLRRDRQRARDRAARGQAQGDHRPSWSTGSRTPRPISPWRSNALPGEHGARPGPGGHGGRRVLRPHDRAFCRGTSGRAGYAPEDVETILLTPHATWITLWASWTGDGKPVFPRATVRVAQADADYWLSDTLLATAPDRMQPFLKKLRVAVAPYIASGRFKPFAARRDHGGRG